jgi:hypothetical protein
MRLELTKIEFDLLHSLIIFLSVTKDVPRLLPRGFDANVSLRLSAKLGTLDSLSDIFHSILFLPELPSRRDFGSITGWG